MLERRVFVDESNLEKELKDQLVREQSCIGKFIPKAGRSCVSSARRRCYSLSNFKLGSINEIDEDAFS